MIFKKASKVLLPSGFRDLLPPDAEREADSNRQLMDLFSSFGYQRVKPPLIEFEETLVSGAGISTSQETFRVMDPISQTMLGVIYFLPPSIYQGLFPETISLALTDQWAVTRLT